MTTRNFAVKAGTALAAATLLSGCFSSSSERVEDPELSPTPPEEDGIAWIRVAHAISDAPNVDVYIDGEIVAGLSDVPFGAASGWLEVPATEQEIAIVPAGEGLDARLDVAGLDGPLSPGEGNYYTIFASHRVNSPWARVYTDVAGGPDEGGDLRVAHLSPDTYSDVWVYISANDQDLSEVDPIPLSYDGTGEGEITDFMTVAAGNYRVRITAPDVEAIEDNVVYDRRDIAVGDGDALTVFAADGSRSFTPVDLYALTGLDETPIAHFPDERVGLRVVHAIEGAPNVDVFVAGDAILTDVAYRYVSDYLPISLGGEAELTVPVEVTGGVFNDDVTVTAGQDYTIVAVETSSDGAGAGLRILPDDFSQFPATDSRVRLFHAVTSSGLVDTVDVYLDGDLIQDGLAEGSASDFDGNPYAQIPSGEYEAAVTVAGDSVENALLEATLNPGGRNIYTVFVFGRESNLESVELEAVFDANRPVEGQEADEAADVTFTLSNEGASAYRFTDVDGADGLTELNVDNAAVTLTVGQRYAFNNTAAGAHPLEFIDSDNNVLLSQGNGDGSFQNDSGVNVEIEGDVITFTLTEELASELSQYRCIVHPGSMVGDINIQS